MPDNKDRSVRPLSDAQIRQFVQGDICRRRSGKGFRALGRWPVPCTMGTCRTDAGDLIGGFDCGRHIPSFFSSTALAAPFAFAYALRLSAHAPTDQTLGWPYDRGART